MMETLRMAPTDIDDYLAGVEEPKRSTLQALRRSILDVVPDAEECISYAMPGFRVEGQMVAGFAAFKNHLSYFPHSGSVIPELGEELAAYDTNRGTLRFAVDEPLPDTLVRRLIEIRMQQLGLTP